MQTNQLTSIKYAIKLRCNTCEQTVLQLKYKNSNTSSKKYILIL